MKLRKTSERSTWNSVVSSFDHALMFHEWDWLDLQEAVQDVAFERLVVEAEGKPVGVFPSPRSAGWPLKTPLMPFPFLGPLVPDEFVVPTLRAWRRRQASRGPVLARFEVGPLMAPTWRPLLTGAGADLHTLNTVMVDLSHGSTEQMQAGYARTHRRSLARARREGAHVRRSAPGEVGELLSALLDEAYRGRGSRSPYPQRVGRLVEEYIEGRDDAASLTAFVGDEPAGAIVVLGGHPTALLWVGGCFRRFRDAAPNVLLYHEAMVWAVAHGCARMDFCASLDDGVRQFKVAFGGQEVAGLRSSSTVLPPGALAVARRVRAGFR